MTRNTTLDTKISSLADVGVVRDELQSALLTLRQKRDPSEVMDRLSRAALTLMTMVLGDAKRKLPNEGLRACSDAAYKANLLPQPLFFSLSGILDWSDQAVERLTMTAGWPEIQLAILLEVASWYYCEYKNGPRLRPIYREEAGAGLPSLDVKIASLADIGILRDELQKALSTLRDADNPISVMNGLSRTALILMSLVFERAGYRKRPSDHLDDCCNKALDARLLPMHIYHLLGSVRVWSNKADHAVEQVALTTGRAEIQLALMLEAVTWYCCEYEAGPRLAFICREEGIGFRSASQPLVLQPEKAYFGDWPLFSGECVGRTDCLEEMRETLKACRALNLTGGPGYGKTRVAFEYAEANKDAYPGGLYFANLTTLPTGTESRGIQLYLNQLLTTLNSSGTEASLLVVDNCEHLPGVAGQEVRRLTRANCNLHILATSRTALNDLQNVPVIPLPLPEETDTDIGALECKRLAEYAAVDLFVRRARRVDPGFGLNVDNAERVVAICRKLGGIPFAIELVAKMVGLRLDDLAESLDQELEVSENDDLAATEVRHGTVYACVRWSINLLSTDTKQFLYHVAIFPSGFSLDAYRDVIGGSSGTSPVDRSWNGAIVELKRHGLIAMGANELYELPGPVRMFAHHQLKKESDYSARRAAYVEWLEAQAELARPLEVGYQPSDKVQLAVANADEAIKVAETVEDPYRAANARSQRAAYLMISGKLFECNRLFRQALPYMTEHRKCEVLLGIGMIMYLKCEFADALDHARESAEIASAIGSTTIQVLATSSQGVLEGFVLGPSAETSDRLDAGIELAKKDGDTWAIAYAYLSKGTYLWHADRLEESERCYLTALKGFDAVNYKLLSVFALNSLGHLARVDGRFAQAAEYYLRSMKMSQGYLFERGRCGCVLGTSGMALGLKKDEDAVLFWGAACRQYERLGVRMIPPIERCYMAKFKALYEATEAAMPGTFNALYRDGQRLTLPQAFDQARAFLTQVEKETAPVGFASYGLPSKM